LRIYERLAKAYHVTLHPDPDQLDPWSVTIMRSESAVGP
jgi:hypothetical protein